ncbi:hypothetical protein NQ314_006827 [Rhamnusium bicolor]|uniref:SWIM-type domain-containing protein n=1 Tax=Rhamnusium bicolor TaxID=1586634 RepID=A0AAV8YXJ9_9CUCU|nr:hypothetical protein NQ314_006827 [Rhamnusium bicolor]
MAPTKHVLKLSAIVEFFSDSDEKRLIARGENAVESNHIKSFHFVPELLLIRGEVHASMRDRIYNVEVNLFKDGAIKDASCTCHRGQYLCHHVAAVCLFGHHNISVTDVECRWAAKKSKEEEVKIIDVIYMGKGHVSCDTRLTEAEITNFHTTLQQYGTAVGFTWLLGPEPTTVLNLITDVEDFIFSEAYFAAGDKQKCFLEKNEGFYNLENIKAVQWVTLTKAKPSESLLKKPNGLVGDNAIIEIKCPYKFREKLMTEELQTDHSYIVYCDGDELVLNKNHEYYHQIQGNLTICDRELCYLFIWTPPRKFSFEVYRDKDWIVNLKLLENFYLQEYLSYIISNAYDV